MYLGEPLLSQYFAMNTIPAIVANVKNIYTVIPCPNGKINAGVLYAAKKCKIKSIFRVGGAQAVAALACGTESIPRVDKIVGPGNIYVATAKKELFGSVGIDMVAGPSEITVIADNVAILNGQLIFYHKLSTMLCHKVF